MVLFTIMGVAGLLCLLFAFFLAESGRTRTSLRTYTLLNAVGSLLLIIYSVHIFAWVFTALNVIWFAFAIIKLVRSEKNSHAPPYHGTRPMARQRGEGRGGKHK